MEICESSVPSRVSPLTMADGVSLACECWHGDGDGVPTVLFAHGFGQTRGAWTQTAATLAQRGCRTVAYDARGHGDSGRPPHGAYHMRQFVDDLVAVATAQPQPPVLVGASMGGLTGIAAAGEFRPAAFAALVLVDITPRWEPAGVERIVAFMRARPEGFADFDEVAQVVAQFLPQRGRKTQAQLAPLLRRGDDGRLHWHWDAAMLAPIAEEGELYQARLLAAARKINVPTLLLSGERSDVVSRDTIDEFLASVPRARHIEVAGATHMLAGDANDAFTREIWRFVQSLSDRESGVAGLR